MVIPDNLGKVLDGCARLIADVVEGILHLDQSTANDTGEIVSRH